MPQIRKCELCGCRGHNKGNCRLRWDSLATQLLERLMWCKEGGDFREPVDPVELGIPDYFDIIKTPMDFGTIQTRLRKEFYGSQEEFPPDMRLVFNNAKTYNPEGHDVWNAANTLSELFERQWAKITAVTSALDEGDYEVEEADSDDDEERDKVRINGVLISPETFWKDDDKDEGETSGAGPARLVTATKGTYFENMYAPLPFVPHRLSVPAEHLARGCGAILDTTHCSCLFRLSALSLARSGSF